MSKRSAVNAVTNDNDGGGDDKFFLGAINSTNKGEWTAELLLNGIPMTFKIDTGAEVTIIPESAATPFKELLRSPEGMLHGAGESSLSVCGQFMGTLQLNTKTAKEEIFMVKNLHKPLVGLTAIQALNLVKRVSTICWTKETILS